jgi:hypothetical protein
MTAHGQSQPFDNAKFVPASIGQMLVSLRCTLAGRAGRQINVTKGVRLESFPALTDGFSVAL